MCGIAGMVFLDGVERSEKMWSHIRFVFNELMVNTEERGHHATGLVSIKRDGSYDFYKDGISPTEMVTTDKTYNSIVDKFSQDTSMVIGHTRWLTKGKAENNDNNHPFDIGNILGVHNGSLKNDDELAKKYKIKRQGEVDSEVVYRLIDKHNHNEVTYKGLKKSLEDTYMRGLFALAFANKNQPNLLHIVKQEKPMSFCAWKEAGVLIFNSQDDLIEKAFYSLKRAGRTLGFTSETTVDYTTLKDDTYVTIDSNSNNFDDLVSEPKKIYLISSAIKTYTGNRYYNSSTKNSRTTTSVDSKRKVSATDSVGRVIEGELDELTGEVIIYSSFDDVIDIDLDEESFCIECLSPLSTEEVDASYNANNPNGEKCCKDCYEVAIKKSLTNTVS